MVWRQFTTSASSFQLEQTTAAKLHSQDPHIAMWKLHPPCRGINWHIANMRNVCNICLILSITFFLFLIVLNREEHIELVLKTKDDSVYRDFHHYKQLSTSQKNKSYKSLNHRLRHLRLQIHKTNIHFLRLCQSGSHWPKYPNSPCLPHPLAVPHHIHLILWVFIPLLFPLWLLPAAREREEVDQCEALPDGKVLTICFFVFIELRRRRLSAPVLPHG